MKMLFSITFLMALATFISASPTEALKNVILQPNNGKVHVEKIDSFSAFSNFRKVESSILLHDTFSPYLLQDDNASLSVGKCTIHICTKLDNGVVIEGVIVIEGIPWYECLAIKVYDFFSNDF
jgi:hypothetical protein